MTAPPTVAKVPPAPLRSDTPQLCGPGEPADDAGLRIGDVAARVGVSTRTLRYYEELGLLGPSGRTAGGERRYQPDDIVQLERIIECKDLLGMNLEEIRVLLASRARLDELRVAYRAHDATPADEGREMRHAILEEALALQTSLVERMDAKLGRLAAFRSEAHADAERCAMLLQQLD